MNTGTLTSCYKECKLVKPFGKTFGQDLLELNKSMPYFPVNSSSRYIHMNAYVRQTCLRIFVATPFITVQNWKPATQVSIS